MLCISLAPSFSPPSLSHPTLRAYTADIFDEEFRLAVSHAARSVYARAKPPEHQFGAENGREEEEVRAEGAGDKRLSGYDNELSGLVLSLEAEGVEG